MPTCGAASAVIYNLTCKQWLIQLRILSVFTFERKNPVSSHRRQSVRGCKHLVMGGWREVSLSLLGH